MTSDEIDDFLFEWLMAERKLSKWTWPRNICRLGSRSRSSACWQRDAPPDWRSGPLQQIPAKLRIPSVIVSKHFMKVMAGLCHQCVNMIRT
jgi:hypothetical protein